MTSKGWKQTSKYFPHVGLSCDDDDGGSHTDIQLSVLPGPLCPPRWLRPKIKRNSLQKSHSQRQSLLHVL